MRRVRDVCGAAAAVVSVGWRRFVAPPAGPGIARGMEVIRASVTPDTGAEKFESLERISLIRETNGNFD